MRRAALLIALTSLLAAPAAWALGELTQKPGTAGCISETGTGGACQDGRALEHAFGVATSPDGRNVYVTSPVLDAIAVFDRDPATGALTQKPGTAGCVSEDGTGGLCEDGRALDEPGGGATSPDSRSAYFAPKDAVAIFDRDPQTGALTQKTGTDGCVSETGTGGACQNGTALERPIDVAVSPDGKSVYVTSRESDAVAIFDRDTQTGALSQKPGAAGCISTAGGACRVGTGLRLPWGARFRARDRRRPRERIRHRLRRRRGAGVRPRSGDRVALAQARPGVRLRVRHRRVRGRQGSRPSRRHSRCTQRRQHLRRVERVGRRRDLRPRDTAVSPSSSPALPVGRHDGTGRDRLRVRPAALPRGARLAHPLQALGARERADRDRAKARHHAPRSRRGAHDDPLPRSRTASG